jgi:hypothetical protein
MIGSALPTVYTLRGNREKGKENKKKIIVQIIHNRGQKILNS